MMYSLKYPNTRWIYLALDLTYSYCSVSHTVFFLHYLNLQLRDIAAVIMRTFLPSSDLENAVNVTCTSGLFEHRVFETSV